MFKKLIYLLLTLILGVLVIFFSGYYYIQKNFIDLTEQYISEIIDKDLKIESGNLSLFKGIKLSGIDFKNKENDDYKVKVKEIDISYKIIELIKKKNMTDLNISFKGVELFYKDFIFNIEDRDYILNMKRTQLKDLNILISSSKGNLGKFSADIDINKFEEYKANFNLSVYRNNLFNFFDIKDQLLEIKGCKIDGEFVYDKEKNLIVNANGKKISVLYGIKTSSGKKIQVPVENMSLDLNIKNEDIELKSNSDIFEGKLSLNGNIKLENGMKSKTRLILSSVSIDAFSKENKITDFPIYGNIYSDINLEGVDFDLNTFFGTGRIRINNAIFKNLGIDNLLLKTGSKTLKEISLKDIKAKATLKNKKISFGDIDGDGPYAKLKGDGYIDLDAKLNFKLDMNMKNALLKKYNIEKYFSEKETFTFKIYGDLFDVKTDSNADDILKSKLKKHEDELKDKIEEKAKDWLKKLF